MRTFGALAMGGVAGFLVLKLLAALVFPLFGFMIGVVGMLVKVALWVGIGYFVYTLFRGRRNAADEAAEA